MIPVISFNILTREYFKENNEINNDFRKRFIFYLIDKWTSSFIRPLIGLQEVTGEWKDDIELILLKNRYKNFSINYGYRGNGYLGIMSLVPDEYKILKIDYINVGNLIKKSGILEEEELSPDVIGNNFLIKLHLLKNNRKFFFLNYHLPVPRGNEKNQLIHAITIKKIMYQLRGEGIIMTADLNIKPDTYIYNLLLNMYIKLESSYKSFHGVEPKMTIHTKDFKNTLDYILISKELLCKNSRVLQYNEERMPNKYNPSDHMPLMSILFLR